VIQVRLFTDAVVGKNCPGGVGFVLLSEEEENPFYYEHKHPIPDGMSQIEGELYGILSGLESIEHVLFSHNLRATDVFMSAYTDCQPALHAIHNAHELDDRLPRILCKRIIRLIAGKYSSPPGGGSGWHFLSAKRPKVPPKHRRFHAHMLRAHELSRAAKAAFRGLL
jgi:ribonuclease HI